MTQELDVLRRRIASARDLHGIVRTMKALAAASIRQFERAAEAIGAYAETVESGLRIALRDRPTGEESPRGNGAGTLAIVFGSDQGMCGQFNDSLVSFALSETAGTAPVWVVVGTRPATRLMEEGVEPAEVFAVPSSVDGVNPAVSSLLLTIEAVRRTKSLEEVVLYHNRQVSGSSYQGVRVPLMPVDLEIFRVPTRPDPASRSLPTFTMERPRLLTALVGQYLFARLYRACVESLTAENISRLMTMQAAEKSIGERLDELGALYHGQRQGMITSELLDIVSGVEALAQQRPRRPGRSSGVARYPG